MSEEALQSGTPIPNTQNSIPGQTLTPTQAPNSIPGQTLTPTQAPNSIPGQTLMPTQTPTPTPTQTPTPFGTGDSSLIGGCSGTRWGCCTDGITPASSESDPCKRVGTPTIVTCGGDNPKNIICRSGTYGCFNNSRVGPCDIKRNNTCVNPIPDSVVIINNENSSIKGNCYQNGDELVCSFPNFCKGPSSSIN